MSDTKLTALTQLADADFADTNLIYIVGDGASRKTTLAKLRSEHLDGHYQQLITPGTENAIATFDALGCIQEASVTLLGTEFGWSSGNPTFKHAVTDNDSIVDIKGNGTGYRGELALYFNAFSGTVTPADLTANRTYTLPDSSGTFTVAPATGFVEGASNLTAQYRIPYVSAAGTLTESSSIVTDASGNLNLGNTKRLGVGKIATTYTIETNGVIQTDLDVRINNRLRFTPSGIERAVIYADASSNLIFETAGTEKVRFDTTGNVLIGTITQYGTEKLGVNGALYVNGTGTFAGKVFVNGATSTTGLESLAVKGDSEAFLMRASSVDAAIYQGLYNSAGARRAYFGFGGSSSSIFDIVNQENGALRFHTNNTVALTIDSSQNAYVNGDIGLPNTTYADQSGIITKGGVRFIHDFNYGNNGTVTTLGRNTFVGEGTGNLTMGSTATSAFHGSYNTGTGHQVLPNLTIGYNNTASGYQSLYSLTTGYNNTAVGVNAARSLTDGYQNTAGGVNALYSLTTGYQNTASGYNSGRFIADGATANQTSTTSTYLGADTKAGANGNVNEVVIGYNAIGNGSNTVTLGNDSITTTLLKGNTLIGTTTVSGTAILTANGYIAQQGVFAEIHVHDASTAQSIATGATYTKSTAFVDNGESANCTADVANDKITITKAGRYRIEGSFSFTCDTNNVVVKGAPFLGGVEVDNVHWERKISTGSDIGNAGFSGFIDVPTANTDLDFRMAHDAAGAVNVTMKYANMNVEMVGTT